MNSLFVTLLSVCAVSLLITHVVCTWISIRKLIKRRAPFYDYRGHILGLALLTWVILIWVTRK